MLKNYFKIAFRTLARSKGYAFINILGLAIGITGATLLLTYVKDETSFDQFHSKADDIARIIVVDKTGEAPRKFASNAAIFASTLVEELPEVTNATILFMRGGHMNFTIDGVRFAQRNYFITDPSFFEVFDFEFLDGNRATALAEPNSVVLSENEAIRYFGKTDVLGEIITSPFAGDFKVTGISKNTPANSHIKFDVLISQNYSDPQWQQMLTSWEQIGPTSYLVLAKGANIADVQKKAEALANERMGVPFADMVDFELQSLSDIHFESANIEQSIAQTSGDKSYILIFISIAVFLVVIASVNYMNLATSRAVFRAKEIGIRKVVGAVKKQLVTQFLMESLLITTLSLIISIGLTDLSMPFFNQLTQKNFDFSWATLGEYLPMLLGLTAVIALLSGVYPSFFMTRFKTVDVLKGERKANSPFALRKVLVIAQFALSIIMIISTIVVTQQMNYINDKNLGFQDNNLVVIDINNGNVRANFKAMRTELANVTGVESVSVSTRVPGEWKTINEVTAVTNNVNQQTRDSVDVFYMGFDENLIETFGFKLKDGVSFTGVDATDSTKILLNETAVATFGLENPIGETIELTSRGRSLRVQVIGVVEDFNFQSLHTKVAPIVLGYWNNPAATIDYFTVKASGNMANVVAGLTEVHNKFDQATAMESHFLDSQLANFYQAERQVSVIYKVGAGLSIFVACLGLFGLASFTVEKRIKELGIRKVLGASQLSLFYLLSSTFAKQVFLAFIIASPFAFWIMKNWLNGFVYHVNISPIAFIVAGLMTMVIALLTVSYRSILATKSNPVDALRSE
ncbi:ABC transporter permease [uncultured Roseivirga sp.]|uniref:ABC transporter permease n=1 Tax=uncultured Roseivirga sp. TaxID=543088 RepID=UPI0030DC3105